MSSTKKYFDRRTNNWYILGLSSIFILIFFPDRRTLKLLKVQCNPTNKKNCGLKFFNSMIPIDPQLQLVLVILHCRYAGAFTMDAIALIAFGLKINSQNDKNNQFVRMAKRGFQSFISNPLVYIQGRLTKFFRSLSSITTVL